MSHVILPYNVPSTINVLFVNDISGSPRAGLAYSDVVVKYAKDNDVSFRTKALSAGDLVELGNGVYRLALNGFETDTPGNLLIVITGAPLLSPQIRDFTAVLFVAAPANQANRFYFETVQGQTARVPVMLLNQIGGGPILNATVTDLVVEYAKFGDVTYTTKTVLPVDWIELGYGFYWLNFNGADTSVLGTFLFTVKKDLLSVLPDFNQFIGQFDVVEALSVTPVTPVLPVCEIFGTLFDLFSNPVVNTEVIARILEVPTLLLGVGISNDPVLARTNSNGFFSMRLMQGAKVDVIIPETNYRRLITVPALGSQDLFTLL